MFDLFSVLFVIVFLIILTVIIVSIVQGIQQRKKDDASPVLEVEATIVTKRTDVRRHRNTNTNHVHNTSHTSYYVTFEVQSKDRLELTVTGEEYGQLAEHDAGKLTFQGTRYLGFERNRN